MYRRQTSDRQIDELVAAWLSGQLGSSGGTGTGGLTSVNVSPDPYNALEERINGLYVPATRISLQDNNALVQKQDGLYVQATQVSAAENNAITWYSDGLYAPKIPADNALLSDVDKAKQELSDTIKDTEKDLSERIINLNILLNDIFNAMSTHDEHEYKNTVNTLTDVFDLSTMYSNSNILLSTEIMVENTSDTNALEIVIEENNVKTMNTTLDALDVQKYVLTPTRKIKLKAMGEYHIFLYINYV